MFQVAPHTPPMVQSKVPHHWVPLTEPGTGKELEVIYISGEIQRSSLNAWLPRIQSWTLPEDVPMSPCAVGQRQLPVKASGRDSCSSEQCPRPSDSPAGGRQEKPSSPSPWDGNLGIYFSRTDPLSILDVNEMPQTTRLYPMLLPHDQNGSEGKKDYERICAPQRTAEYNSRVFISQYFPGWFLLRSKCVLKNLWERCWHWGREKPCRLFTRLQGWAISYCVSANPVSLSSLSNLSLILFLWNMAIGESPINHVPYCWKNPTRLSAGKHTSATKEKTVSSF